MRGKFTYRDLHLLGEVFGTSPFLFFSDRLPLTTEEIRLFCRVDFSIYTRQGCPCNFQPT